MMTTYTILYKWSVIGAVIYDKKNDTIHAYVDSKNAVYVERQCLSIVL